MTIENSFISKLSLNYKNATLFNVLVVFLGTVLISALAQISLPLPWTPVPITGQTFAVAFMALNWGRKRAVLVMFSYFTIAAMGFPVLALGKAGITLGPTFGYLLGMLVAAFVMGHLSDIGWTKSFLRLYLAALLGSIIIFSLGVFVLSFYLPANQLFISGVLPFLPGDFIKSIIACGMTHSLQRLTQK